MSTAIMSAPNTAHEVKTYFETITAFIRKHPGAAPLVSNHVAAKHDIHSLAAFHVSSAITNADRLSTYKEIAIALPKWKRGEEYTLLGAQAEGQAEAPAPEEQKAEPPPDDEPEETPEPVAKPTRPTPAAKAEIRRPPQADDPLTAKLREILIALIGDLPAALDESKIRELAAAVADERDAEREGKMRGEIAEMAAALERMLAEQLKNLPSTARTLELKIGERIGKVEGITHRQLLQVVTWLAADVPAWIWGPAGSGKTTLGEQAAQALGIPFYGVSIDETITVGKLVGFKSAATGEHVEGFLYRAYKEGGLVLLDEIDTNSTAIASLNALTANSFYTFGNGERVAKHKDFRVLAGANTCGMGAVAGYTARVRLDAATLDRFALIRFDYDWGMINALACGQPSDSKSWQPEAPADEDTCRRWVGWVEQVSKKVGNQVLVSPRAALNGVRALRAGVPIAEVAEALVFRFCSPDTKQNITSSIGGVPMKTSAVAAAA